MYQFEYCADAGILEVRVRGLWTAETVASYTAALRRQAAAARAHAGRLKLLVNATNAPVQPDEAAQRLNLLREILSEPGDRVAVLVASNLVKAQSRTIIEDWTNANIFVSDNAARTWLCAHDATLHRLPPPAIAARLATARREPSTFVAH